MQQSVRFKGLSLTPDEMAVENGALSLCGNLELHDGALRPSILTGTQISEALLVGKSIATLLYIHETGNYKHFIALQSDAGANTGTEANTPSLHWFDEDGSYMNLLHTFPSGTTIQSVNSVGNTLIICASDGIHYAIYHPDATYGSYQYLGQKPPFLQLSFSIDTQNHYENYDLGGIDSKSSNHGFQDCFQQTSLSCAVAFSVVANDSFSLGEICASIKEEKQSDITQSIYALVNRTNNLIARNGRFYANFFVRYCYRMFDNTMIMHSSPVFIPVQVPDSYAVASANLTFNSSEVVGDTIKGKINIKDEVAFSRQDGDFQSYDIKINKAAFYYYPRNVSLLYSLVGEIDELKKWKDVIKSIDVFITPPITNVDTSQKISSLAIYSPNYGLGISGRADHYTYANNQDKIGYVRVKFPTISADVYKNKLANASSFYKVSSLNVEDLKGCSSTPLPVDKQAIYEITLQEQMKDDYKSHNSLFSSGSYVYNHRLNLYGIHEKLFSGFNRYVMFPNSELLKGESGVINYHYLINKIVTVLNTSSGTKYVEATCSTSDKNIDAYMLANLVKFYPDSRATQMVIFALRQETQEQVIFSFPLTPCSEINGSMHMGDFTKTEEEFLVTSFPYTEDTLVELPSKLYTSEADNPFHFPLNAINTVGIGHIQGIASTTRALSQGQFGQYPLMAFSTDGIWALNVSASGTYSSIHPISREVCSNPGSITQLDQSVAFVTNRSLSRIAESQVVSMSDMLDGPYFNIPAHLGKLANFFAEAEDDAEDIKTIKSQMRQLINFTEPPIDFFQHCKIIYDYKNSRILCLDVSNKAKSASADTVALSYSIRDQAWSTFLIKNVLTALNSYPHPYIQYRDGRVVCLDQGYNYTDPDETEYAGILVTRTLKFDEDTAPNAITGFIHSLTSDVTPVMWLYGSHDNQNWHYLGRTSAPRSHYLSSKSYRYFRLALYLWLESKDQYFATRLEVIRRFNKF